MIKKICILTIIIFTLIACDNKLVKKEYSWDTNLKIKCIGGYEYYVTSYYNTGYMAPVIKNDKFSKCKFIKGEQ
jgi:hypothetical protein